LERAKRVAAVRAAVGGAGQRPVCIQTVEEDVQRVTQEKANDGGDDGGQGAAVPYSWRLLAWQYSA
jgi:hypothetical protein